MPDSYANRPSVRRNTYISNRGYAYRDVGGTLGTRAFDLPASQASQHPNFHRTHRLDDRDGPDQGGQGPHRAHSIKLRCQGLSYREIAKITGVSHGMAWLDCKAVLDEAAEHRRGTWG